MQLIYFLQHGAAGPSNAAVEGDAVHDGHDVFGEEVWNKLIQGLTMFKTILLQQNAAEVVNVSVEQERSPSQVKSTQQ